MLKTILGSTEHVETIFQYLFGVITKYRYREIIGDKELAKALWKKVECNGYILRNCKLYLYASLKNKAAGLPTSPARFEIEAADVKLLRSVHLPISLRHKAYSLFDFDNLEGALLGAAHLDAHMGKFINRKLRFLASYGVTTSEIRSTLVHAAIYTLRKQYPFYESELHALNTCKTAIHNAGMLLIQYWTRDKRQALVNENGLFQSRLLQLDFASDVSVRPEHEAREVLQDLERVVSSRPKKDQQLIRLMAGNYDPGLSLYLGVDNNDAAATWDYARYLKAVANYRMVSAQGLSEVLQELRQSMT
jgi:hypothetical protein